MKIAVLFDGAGLGTAKQWLWHQYEAIGNGVPVYMAKAFGEAYSK